MNAILKNKQEVERRTSEHNRLLTIKIEAENKENKRLSMLNEQLQFRLQLHPNLSQNESTMFSSLQQTTTTAATDSSPVCSADGMFEIQTRNQKTKLTRASTLISHSYELNISDLNNPSSKEGSTTDQVRLRSKSLRNQMSLGGGGSSAQKKPLSSDNSSLFSSYYQPSSSSSPFASSTNAQNNQQFRPVSEHFDFNLTDRDIFMTRSVYVPNNMSTSSHQTNTNQEKEAEFLSQFDMGSSSRVSMLGFTDNEEELSSFSNTTTNQEETSRRSLSGLRGDQPQQQQKQNVIEEENGDDETKTESLSSSSMVSSTTTNNNNNQSIIILD